MVKRIVVGAHYGAKDWLAQRVTALVMAAYTLLFAGMVSLCTPVSYEQWRALFSPQWMRLATFVFFLSVFLHAWIGVRDILMDYVKPTWLRLGLEIAAALLLVAYAGWAIQILWSV
ncbi:MAG TPA: succinate dehydrogenase, hydrophobic membrane anchor protein [Burkholderiales bacterium]|nr:succinate dehydrogenase, hydrophobic membrane anchor protein [Burkholderiales bacterium]